MAITPNLAHNPGRSRRVSSAVEAATEAIDDNIGSFEPENMDDLAGFLAGLPRLFESLAGSFARIADRFGDELPVHGDVQEHLRELASQAAGLQDYAAEADGIFRAAHADDLNRLENPRPGEEFTDYSRQ
jgi:hypothetical protein